MMEADFNTLEINEMIEGKWGVGGGGDNSYRALIISPAQC